tara:strand:- start:325 stop:633 length:309 start_codon:yes stop_codon:yes gene_type:complete
MRRYSRIKQRRKPEGKYYINTILPDIPLSQNDTYIITQDGDRLDNLSFEFYKDTQFWWVIAAANPNKLRKDSYYVPLGEQIRIPSDPFTYVDNFTDFNNNNR